jgi:hypothetical protein
MEAYLHSPVQLHSVILKHLGNFTQHSFIPSLFDGPYSVRYFIWMLFISSWKSPSFVRSKPTTWTERVRCISFHWWRHTSKSIRIKSVSFQYNLSPTQKKNRQIHMMHISLRFLGLKQWGVLLTGSTSVIERNTKLALLRQYQATLYFTPRTKDKN